MTERTGFTMPLERLKVDRGVSLVPYALSDPFYRCIGCGKAVRDDAREVTASGFTIGGNKSAKFVHAIDDSPVCEDWVGAVLREVEERLRRFDREGRERGLPGPLQRDPSEPIVVEVTWCRNPGTE